MDFLRRGEILGISYLSIAAAVGGGVAFWMLEDAIQVEIKQRPWLFPLIGMAVGVGAANFFKGRSL